jgi:tetratricopeptide (TPR) repeat protein
MNKKLATGAAGAFVFFMAYAVYLFCLAPTLTFGDSGELISDIATLGVPHPTGFPLYVLLGRLFYFLPLANPGFKINLLSAVSGALAVTLFFFALHVFLRKKTGVFLSYFLPAIISMTMIFSYTLWSQAVMSRIYTLNAAFCAAVLLLFFLYTEEKSPVLLYLWALLTGLGAGLHLTFMAFSAVLWIQLAFDDFAGFKKASGWIAFFFFTGLSVYAFLLIRGSSDITLKWSDLNSFSKFFSYITQEQYSIKKFSRGWEGMSVFFAYIKDVLLRELSPAAIILFMAGVIAAIIKKFRYTASFLVIFFASIIMLLFYGNYTDLKLAFRYMIPSYIIMMFFICLLVYYIYDLVGGIALPAASAVIFSALMLFLSIGKNSYEDSKRNNFMAYNYASDLLLPLPADKAGLFATGDNNIYPLAYFKFILGKKPNISIYDDILTVFKDALPIMEKSKSSQTQENIMQALSMGYTSLYSATEVESRLFSEIPCGLIYKISDKPGEPENQYWKMYSMKGLITGPYIYHDYEEREIAGTYYCRLANFYKNQAKFDVYEWLLAKASDTGYDSVPVLGNVALVYSLDPFIKDNNLKARDLFMKSYALNPDSFPIVFNIASFYGRAGNPQQAAYFFEKAVKLDPYNYSARVYLQKALAEYRAQSDKEIAIQEKMAHFNSGMDLLKQNKLDEALAEFNQDIKLFPGNPRSYFNIGLIYSMKNDLKTALVYYDKTLQLDPNSVPALANKGLCYIRLNDYKKAKEYFEKALKLDPTQARLATDLEKLKKMGY